jgi:DUF2939 family protein
MRILVSISVLVALWLAYAASPFLGVYRLVDVVGRRDVAALSERVDFPALRASLSTQIAGTYLRITGRGGDPGSLNAQVFVAVAASVAAPIAAELVTPEALLDLLKTGQPVDVVPNIPPMTKGLNPESLGNLWRAYLNSELGIARFFLNVPVDKPRQERFRLQFCLRSWTWMLCGIELPEPLLVVLAQEIVRREKPR